MNGSAAQHYQMAQALLEAARLHKEAGNDEAAKQHREAALKELDKANEEF